MTGGRNCVPDKGTQTARNDSRKDMGMGRGTCPPDKILSPAPVAGSGEESRLVAVSFGVGC
jgi:hypothetical protein